MLLDGLYSTQNEAILPNLFATYSVRRAATAAIL